MAESAHAYVRGSTVRLYEWLEQTPRAAVPDGPPVWIFATRPTTVPRLCSSHMDKRAGTIPVKEGGQTNPIPTINV
jgi:hypothetical protein